MAKLASDATAGSRALSAAPPETNPGPADRVNWRGVIQAYLAEHPGTRAIDIARALGCTEAEALSALSDQVWDMPGTLLSNLLAEISAWGPLLVLVRNGDAVAEVEVPGEAGYRRGEWLNWINPAYNLHIRVGATRHILGLVRQGQHGVSYSFNLVNQAGEVFCRFYARTPAAKERFLAFCR